MCRIEEEQSFEELKILRELVHERFYKQEELAEVRSPLRRRARTLHSERFPLDVLTLGEWRVGSHSWFCLWVLMLLIVDCHRACESLSLILQETAQESQAAVRAVGCCSTSSPGFLAGAAGPGSQWRGCQQSSTSSGLPRRSWVRRALPVSPQVAVKGDAGFIIMCPLLLKRPILFSSKQKGPSHVHRGREEVLGDTSFATLLLDLNMSTLSDRS